MAAENTKIKEKDKPQLKNLKILEAYLDYFQVIYREFRHYSRAFNTESLVSVTQSVIDEDEDDTNFKKVIDKKKKGS